MRESFDQAMLEFFPSSSVEYLSDMAKRLLDLLYIVLDLLRIERRSFGLQCFQQARVLHSIFLNGHLRYVAISRLQDENFCWLSERGDSQLCHSMRAKCSVGGLTLV